MGRFFIYNFADTDDYRKFPSRALPAAPSLWEYPSSTVEHGPRTITVEGREQAFDAFLEEHRTVAFLVVRRDTVVYERYFKEYHRGQLHASFSMAKSVTSTLIGCAVADGYIRTVQQPVTDFIPELKENGFDRVTVEHLLQMTGGLKFNESYSNPFGDAASFYYGRRLYRAMARMKLAHEPGTHFEYQSGSSQLLGWVLERALRAHNDPRTVTQYLNDKLWAPLGMEYPASWSIDRKKGGIEKTFCCLNAPARDFAKATGQLAKTDRLDAFVLARMGQVLDMPRYEPKSPWQRRLGEWTQRRTQLVDMLAAERQRAEVIEDPVLRRLARAHIASLERVIRELDREIAAQVLAQPELGALRSLKGVGPVLQATLACELPELGRLSGKAIAKLAGVAPLARDSGTLRGRRTIWGGRPQIRSPLYMAAMSAARFDPQLRAFYESLRARGKAAKVAIVAVMRKMLVILNARMRVQLALQDA